jgi:LmbE family N-acetylglucosaminyl deacetylase
MEHENSAPMRILVIAAHPDDIEFGVAGSVARWSDEGAEVYYCLVTDGAAGSNDPDTDLKQLVERRRQEQLDAAAIVGVKEVRFLGYADGYLEPTLQLRRDLTRLIRELRPQRVIIMDPTTIMLQSPEFDYINHPDHRASGEAALYAVFPSAGTRPIFPELLAEGFEPHEVKELWLFISEKEDVFVDISSVIERKIQSLLCHKSQLSDEVADMVRHWSAEAGKQAGYEYAEGFRVLRFQREQPQTEGIAEAVTTEA